MEDTTVLVWANRQDPRTEIKILQYVNINYHDLDPVLLDSLFQFYMRDRFLKVPESYIGYYDLKAETLLSGSISNPDIKAYNIVTPMDTLDIINSIGVIAYVNAPPQIILRPVMFQFVTGIVLNIIALICIILLFFEIRNLYKEGYRILGSIARWFHLELSEQKRLTEKIKEKQEYEKVFQQLGLLDELYKKVHGALSYSEKLAYITDCKEGKLSFTKTFLELEPFLFYLKLKYEKDTEDKKVDIDLYVDQETFIYTDEIYFEKILTELLDNSVRYSKKSVGIRICVLQKDNKTVIDIVDNGWGIPQKDLDHVFEITYKVQSHSDDLNDNSLGLGLPFVQTFVHALGGEISLKSKENTDTHIRLTFFHTKKDLSRLRDYMIMLKEVRGKR